MANRNKIEAMRAQHFEAIPDSTDEGIRRFLPAEDILDRLDARYAHEEIPPCRVCGKELSIQSMGGGDATVYGCAAPEGVTMGAHLEHYRESKWKQRRSGDSEVIALVALVRELAQDEIRAED